MITFKKKVFDDQVGSISTSVKKFIVDDFKAEANGTDDTEAFQKAWEEACSCEAGVLVVPESRYRLKPLRFSGPCKSNLTVVQALTFYKCQNLVVGNLKIQNAQQMHVSFQSSSDVLVSNLMVTSPEDSPNTDGIHVTRSQNIQIINSFIETGDDCISIVSGSQNVQAMDISCGPGHGISIGSLGSGNSEAHVSGVTIDGAKLTGTTNGVRIKTWQGGSGYASNIIFQNIEMHNVSNPIIIDQYYCDHKSCKEKRSAVQVKNVVYKNIKGTSASEVAIKFDCSKTYPCQGILLENVILESEAGNQTAKALCNNVNLAELGVVSPHCP
ncbi:hypothetical protein GH714_033329 [Hevea brasiliensis]|uniref:Pectate lyase superfamily protein domain-containing protein n=1 Tax=Hevea brasiliensis TaxID=3981 RepID=A0A6A6M6C6_HEVBR|nr:hypothetical protein GH714_033329 [Hevea brasiliensis]